MDLTRLLFPVCGVFCSTLWFAGVVGFVCQSPQYIEIKSTGKVDCLFPEGLHNLFWYNTTDVFHEEAVVTLLDSVKSGQGFLSGEFDIDPNGALIINNVTLEHEGTYTAIVLERPSSIVIRYTVNVSVVAPAFIPWPRISRCNNASEICFQILDRHSEISCFIQDARPAVPLMWIVRTNSGDLNISSHLSVSNKSFSFFTSRVTTTNPFIYTSRLALLVCKATSPPGLLENYESFVLIQNSEIVFPASPVKKYVDIKSKLELNCTDNQVGYLVWQRKHYFESTFSNVVVAVLSGGNLHNQIGEDDFTVKASGMLVANDVITHHEGAYRCISGNGLEDGVVVYEVTVFALPVPAYLVVDGCDHQQHCVLEAQPEGHLQCSVRGIRPEVNIEFRPLHEKTLVQFYDNELTVKNIGDVLDISLISKYRLNDANQTRMTIQCRVIETDIHQLLLSTNFDLIVKGRMTSTEKNFHNTKDESEEKRYYWIIAVVLPALLLLFIPIYILKVNYKRQQRTDQRTYSAEDTPMMPLSREAQKDELISQLKAKYQDLYNAIKPIPYIRDKLLRVDKVFVDGGIQYLAEKRSLDGHGTWDVLDSYHSILSDPRVQSSRYILEGDPGYGKTTLTLQLAYDWCKETPPYYIKDKDIFCLLRLRQLGGVTSIYRAIKLFLLPKDSALTEKNIEDILCNSSSLLVVLDGYDEYPDQDLSTDCDVLSVITRNMFQKAIVILTTRTSCLPMQYSPLTTRLKLTGFDDNARDQYIKGAVVGDDAAAAMELKQRLKKNPVLRDLCQIPLFFVMFAHITHESDLCLAFQTVTNLFHHLISCLHSHMKNKLNENNVKMNGQRHDLFEKEHQKLDLLAFDMLKCRKKQIEYRREDLCEELGKEFYDQYLRIGVLVEEELLSISSKDIDYKTEVRFYHKLFCEWYAAHHLSEYASKIDGTIDHYLDSYDPIDLQYLYLFACGLNAKAAEYIIEYLKSRNDATNFITVCITEQDGITEHVLKEVKDLCSNEIKVDGIHSLLLQRSTIQLLHIASTNEINISSVYLIDSFSKVIESDGICIQLKSKFCIPVLNTLKKLMIEGKDRQITARETEDILRYSSMCLELEELVFFRCLVPRCVQTEYNAVLKSRNVKVCWTSCHLNFESGLWDYANKGGEMMDADFQVQVDWCTGRRLHTNTCHFLNARNLEYFP